jgi:hypothetical protein
MRQIWIGLFATAVMITDAQLSAQSVKPVTLGIAAGAAIPAGDFADAYNTGFNGTVGLGLSSVGAPLGVRFEGMYNKFPGRDDLLSNQPDARIVAGTASLVYALPGQGIRPYLIGGGGYYGLKLDRPNAESINKFGINGGVGALFPLSGFDTYIEARFHNVFTEVSSTQFVPVTIGIVF